MLAILSLVPPRPRLLLRYDYSNIFCKGFRLLEQRAGITLFEILLPSRSGRTIKSFYRRSSSRSSPPPLLSSPKVVLRALPRQSVL
jgi:hypothetical protein